MSYGLGFVLNELMTTGEVDVVSWVLDVVITLLIILLVVVVVIVNSI